MTKVKGKKRANPPSRAEIIAARKALDDLFCRCVDDDPTPVVMECWRGEGWHKDEIHIGILIGMEIMRKRHERKKVSN